jgi:hypothetical protein
MKVSEIQGHYFIWQLSSTTSYRLVYRINLAHLPDLPIMGLSTAWELPGKVTTAIKSSVGPGFEHSTSREKR